MYFLKLWHAAQVKEAKTGTLLLSSPLFVQGQKATKREKAGSGIWWHLESEGTEAAR